MIPLYKPHIGKKEIKSVLQVLKSGKLSRGKEVKMFEIDFANYVKQKYAIAVNSGTSGLHLAVKAMGWGPGDEIITTPLSYVASANSILFEKATPVFVDINPQTLNMDVEKIEEKITPKTKGILLVHLLGLPVEIKKISALKKKYNLGIVEDVCEAMGSPSNNFDVTKVGDISVFGFHENKQITTGGEGGVITTNKFFLAKKCRSMRDQGRSEKKKWLKNVILGFNYRMTEMQAAFGRAQLKSIKKFLEKRIKIANKYSYFLKDVKKIRIPDNATRHSRSWFLYFIIFNKERDRKIACDFLSSAGVSFNKNYFLPIYKFPMYSNLRQGQYKNTEYIFKRMLVLPIYYEMTDGQIKFITDSIKYALKQ